MMPREENTNWTPDRIRRLRFLLGKISQAELGKLLDVATVTIQTWEQGIYTPNPLNVIALDELEAKALKMKQEREENGG